MTKISQITLPNNITYDIADKISTVTVTGTGNAVTTISKGTDGNITATKGSTFLTSHQDISGKENTSNKVSSWSSTLTDAHYPSEKLVKTSLDGKQNTLPATGASNKGIYVSSAGTISACSYEVNKSVPSDAVFTDTHYTNTFAIQGNGTTATTFAQNANKTLNIKPGSNVTVTADSTNSAITIASSYVDTKNTAGTSNKTGTKMYLAAATEQSSNPVTYSNSNVYIGTDNCLYSGGTKVLTSHQSLAAYRTASAQDAIDDTFLLKSQKGAASGLAELDSNGKVPTSQLPSFVSDVIEGYYYNGKFYKDSSHTQEITGETGKIYVDLTTNKTYRWSGTQYTEISASLALGETSSTAYRGDRGAVAYNHSQDGSVHVTSTDKSNWNGKQSQISATGASNKPVYFSAAGTVAACGFTVDASVPSNAKFTDTLPTISTSGSGNAVTALSISGSTITATKGSTFLTSHQDISGKEDKTTAVHHTASTAVGSATKPVYVASNGDATACTYSLNKTVPSDAKFTDTIYSGSSTITINNSNSVSVVNGLNTFYAFPYSTTYADVKAAYDAGRPIYCGSISEGFFPLAIFYPEENVFQFDACSIYIDNSGNSVPYLTSFKLSPSGWQQLLENVQREITAVSHTASTAVGSATKPVYVAADGKATACTYSLNKDVPSTAVFTDTVPSAYCTTAAGTAAKAATCTSYVLTANTYVPVLIATANTAQSALTLNINGKGAKPIYINGTASSSSNYTLPAGTYIVFYNGTNYYFRTDGTIPGKTENTAGITRALHGGGFYKTTVSDGYIDASSTVETKISSSNGLYLTGGISTHLRGSSSKHEISMDSSTGFNIRNTDTGSSGKNINISSTNGNINLQGVKTVVGKNEAAATNAIFTVGNGTSSSALSNAASIDSTGNLRVGGGIYFECDADSTGGKLVSSIGTYTGTIAVGATSVTVNFTGTYLSSYCKTSNNKKVLTDETINLNSVVFELNSAATEAITCTVVAAYNSTPYTEQVGETVTLGGAYGTVSQSGNKITIS